MIIFCIDDFFCLTPITLSTYLTPAFIHYYTIIIWHLSSLLIPCTPSSVGAEIAFVLFTVGLSALIWVLGIIQEINKDLTKFCFWSAPGTIPKNMFTLNL